MLVYMSYSQPTQKRKLTCAYPHLYYKSRIKVLIELQTGIVKKMISGFKHYFPQVPYESAAKCKRNKPVNPTIKLSNWNE